MILITSVFFKYIISNLPVKNSQKQCQQEQPGDLGQDHHVTIVIIHDLDLGLHIKVEEAEVDIAAELVHHGADEANTGMLHILFLKSYLRDY